MPDGTIRSFARQGRCAPVVADSGLRPETHLLLRKNAIRVLACEHQEDPRPPRKRLTVSARAGLVLGFSVGDGVQAAFCVNRIRQAVSACSLGGSLPAKELMPPLRLCSQLPTRSIAAMASSITGPQISSGGSICISTMALWMARMALTTSLNCKTIWVS